ncbi:MAG: ATP-binding protein [Syntrophobacteraceae bacterium]|jgi:hypothetical protein
MGRAFDAFSVDNLNRIFKLDKSDPARLITRENSWLEFKESFNWGSRAKYAKTMAALANAQGGYIVFGIKSRPHEIIGLTGTNFENIDGEKITAYLNKTFSPEIAWEQRVYEIAGRRVGIIYVADAKSKPVVCTGNEGDDLKESDIYYRYRARSERVKFAELRAILELERQKEREQWLHHLRHIAKVGVSNVGILDTVSGEVVGHGGRLLISKDLLDKVSFILEGRFAESTSQGVPTLRLIGDVQSIDSGLLQPIKRVHVPKALNSSEIIKAFLDQERVISPLDYIKQICYESSGYLPVYWFIHLAGLNVQEVLKEVAATPSRSQAKEILIRRLSGDDPLQMGSLTTASEASSQRLDLLRQIKDRGLQQDSPPASSKRFCEALSNLKAGDFVPDQLFPIIKRLFFSKYDDMDGNTATCMRKAICHLDKVMYRRWDVAP